MPDFITDSKGRKITTRKINVMEQVKLLRAIGKDHSQNQPYVELVMMAASVSDIDGVPFVIPTNEKQIDAIIARIDDEGFAALIVNMNSQIQELMDQAENVIQGEAVTVTDPLEQSA